MPSLWVGFVDSVFISPAVYPPIPPKPVIFIHLSTNTKWIVQMCMLLLLLVLTYQLPATSPLPLPFWGSLGTSHPRFVALWGLWTYRHIKSLKLPFHWTWKEASLCSSFPWPLQIWKCHLQTIWLKILFPIMWLLLPQYSSPHQILWPVWYDHWLKPLE